VSDTGIVITVELRDDVWAPRIAQVRRTTVPTLLDRLAAHGVVEAFGRLAAPEATRSARDQSWFGSWVGDSDLAKWMEAAALTGRHDLLDPVAAQVVGAQHDDGYLHSFYGQGGVPRYVDFDSGHECYCMGHFVEAGVTHHAVTGRADLLDPARRVGDHLVRTFGSGRDERIDLHPEAELALCRLAEVTGDRRLVDLAAWMVEGHLRRGGVTLDTVVPGGHAVRFVYLVSAMAELAWATGEPRWRDASVRLWGELVAEHSHCTGHVGGRWMGEAVGRAYELGDDTSYAESCGAVAMAHLARRMWRLTGDPTVLDHLDTLLYNAIPAGVGADGTTWTYANALGFDDDAEQNCFVLPFEYGPSMALQWFPFRRHEWFDVMCCPPNLARAFAAVPTWVADLLPGPDRSAGRAGSAGSGGDPFPGAAVGPVLRIGLPVSAHIEGGGWDVEVESAWPWTGDVRVDVRRAPSHGRVAVRVPGEGFVEVPAAGPSELEIPVTTRWWSAVPEATALLGRAHLRRGPVVYALDDRAVPGADLRRVVVDVTAPIDDRDPRAVLVDAWVDETPAHPVTPYRPVADGSRRAIGPVVLRPYHEWPDGIGALRIWLAT